jgi:predicted enzyme related to lactoylglutathione lyase
MLGPIDTVRIFTDDLTRAVAFYRDTLDKGPAVADETMAVFDTGSVKLMIEAVDPEDSIEEDELVGRFTGVTFAVNDIRAAYAALSDKGVRFDGRPEIQPWGGALAHFFDADGNVLTLVQYPKPD